MPPKRRSETALERSKTPQREPTSPWTEGDFTLVSADEEVFKIDSIRLLAASTVFRDAHGMGNNTVRQVLFTDPELESTAVLKMFLSLLVSGDLSSTTGERRQQSKARKTEHQFADSNFLNLFAFCDKYECPLVRRSALLCLRDMVHRGDMSPKRVFRIGATVRDVDTCAAAVRANGDSPLRLLSLSSCEDIPAEYLWALEHRHICPMSDGEREKFVCDKAQVFTSMVLQAEKFIRDMTPTGLPLPTEDDHWAWGDLKLVSSDNVSFMVESYHILSARWAGEGVRFADDSPVLRERIKSQSDPYIVDFTRRDTEKATVIRMFLELITTGQISFSTVATLGDGPSLTDVDNLASFLQAYECTAARSCLLLQIHHLLALNAKLAFPAFVIGARSDDPTLCIEAVRRGAKRQWNLGSWIEFCPNDDTRFPLDKAHIFDVKSWSFEQWRRVPQKYVGFLILAARKRAPSTPLFWTKFRSVLEPTIIDTRGDVPMGTRARCLDWVLSLSANPRALDFDWQLADEAGRWNDNDRDFDPEEDRQDRLDADDLGPCDAWGSTDEEYETDSQASETRENVLTLRRAPVNGSDTEYDVDSQLGSTISFNNADGSSVGSGNGSDDDDDGGEDDEDEDEDGEEDEDGDDESDEGDDTSHDGDDDSYDGDDQNEDGDDGSDYGDDAGDDSDDDGGD